MERSESVEVCTVCHEHMDIMAIGACNHPICYRCSSRMRILCEQMYCPICRGHLQRVLFMKHYDKFENVNIVNFKKEMSSIYLESEDIEKAFKQLLTIQCTKCPNRPCDKHIDGLRDHLRKEHTLFFCDLCLNHLNIFPFERKCYNRKDLATHRRVGDADDKSYKGHPLCVFCDDRYMDSDELLRHLRKDHYFCHICDADGSNDYYNDYPDLEIHFRDSHFLCEEEDCGNPTTQFTNVFRNNIDLKAHKASHHTKGMSKSQIREASRLEIEIQLPPRRQGRDRGTGRISGRDYEEVHEAASSGGGGGARGRGGYNGPGSSRGRGHRKPDMYQENQEELERAIEASKRDAPGVKRMSWSAEDIRQDFPALSSQETTSTTASTPTTTSAAVAPTTTTTNVVNNSNSALTTSMAARISYDKMDDGTKAFPQLKKNSAKNNNKSEKSGRNSPNVKDKKNAGRTSPPVARVMQPVPTSKKVKEEDFPDLSSSKNRNSNLIKLGAWTQNSQRTDLVRPNIQVEPQKSNVTVPKPRPQSASNSLASVGMSLCPPGPSSLIKKTKEPKSNTKTPSAKPVNINTSDFPTLSSKPKPVAVEPKTIPNTNSGKPVNTKSQKDFPSLGGGKPPQSVTNNNLKWGQSKNKKHQSKVSHDDDFEIPVAALENPPPVSQIKKEIEPNPNGDLNSKNKKKKKKSKEKGENSESNVENVSPAPSSNVSDKPKQSKDVPKKQNGGKKDKGPAATLDGIAMGLLNEEKNRASTNSSKPKDASKMLPKKTKENDSMELSKTATSSAKDSPVLVPNLPASVQDIASLNDFPSLSTSVKSPPPGFQKTGKKPPPGFGSSGPSRPPPGFSKADDKIPESTPNPVVVKTSYTYIQPAEFQPRNQALVKRVKEALSVSENFDEFKTKSWQFRQNEIMASEYYYGCEKLMGKERFGEIFPELLVLLPDIKKQQDLLSVHHQSVKKLSNNNVLRISGKSQKAPWSAFSDFQVCPTCNQVVLHSDSATHASNHSASDYPALARAKDANDYINRGSWVPAK